MRRKRTVALALLFTAAFLVVSAGCERQRNASSTELPAGPAKGPALNRTVLLSGLETPWDLAFTPDGAMLFTEKCRGLSVRLPDGTVRRLFGTSGAAVVAEDFFCQGQSGMHGVAVDPEFKRNRTIYVFMPSQLSTPAANRVVRLTLSKGYSTVSQRTDIVTDIPFKNSFNRWGRAGAHSGGRLRFSPLDGFLYVTTGDNHNGTLPQDLTLLGGKILRIDGNGGAAPDNGTPPGGDPRIFTYGHRNVQGIAFHPDTGQPFSCEHGPGHHDEVTPLKAGGNGGWDPAPEPGVSCPSNYCGYISNNPEGTPTSMTDLGKFPDAMQPAWDNDGDSEGMCPCIFLKGEKWGPWNGRLAVGFLRGSRIEILQLDQTGITTKATRVSGIPSERIRSLVQAPDGDLVVTIDGGEIWRLTPNLQP
ncbi:MAG: PQQ-dependent sugar dehydrogenase [Syntrophotaleaceae bacterium]